jgi:hypothetical protein
MPMNAQSLWNITAGCLTLTTPRIASRHSIVIDGDYLPVAMEEDDDAREAHPSNGTGIAAFNFAAAGLLSVQ